MSAPYFTTPFVFDTVMQYLGEFLAGGSPYSYSYTSVPTDAASYAANVTWTDSRTQPTWSYLAPGGSGFAQYSVYYQNYTPLYPSVAEVGVDQLYSDLASQIVPQVQSDWTATSGTAAILHKPMLSIVATSGSYGDLLNRPAARSTSIVTHALNTAFQVSASRDCMAVYTVNISCTNGQNGTCSLQYSSTSGGTYTEVARFTDSNAGGLALTTTSSQPLTLYIPAGYYVKMVTSGSATISYITGQETLL